MAYNPGPTPVNPDDILGYLSGELLQIASEFNKVEEGQYLKIWQTAPQKPREGMLAVAAGAPGWNPGAGKGLYEYKSGSWVKL